MTAAFDEFGTGYRESIDLADLLRVEDLCAVFEGSRLDSDGVRYWCYTVGGRLDGRVIGGREGGCLVGGEAIIVHAADRREADAVAGDGLAVTVDMERRRRLEDAAERADVKKNAGIIAHGEAVSGRKH